jgi:hypothetical protein
MLVKFERLLKLRYKRDVQIRCMVDSKYAASPEVQYIVLKDSLMIPIRGVQSVYGSVVFKETASPSHDELQTMLTFVNNVIAPIFHISHDGLMSETNVAEADKARLLTYADHLTNQFIDREWYEVKSLMDWEQYTNPRVADQTNYIKNVGQISLIESIDPKDMAVLGTLLHERFDTHAKISYSDIADSIHGIQDLLSLGKALIIVEDIRKLSSFTQAILLHLFDASLDDIARGAFKLPMVILGSPVPFVELFESNELSSIFLGILSQRRFNIADSGMSGIVHGHQAKSLDLQEMKKIVDLVISSGSQSSHGYT